MYVSTSSGVYSKIDLEADLPLSLAAIRQEVRLNAIHISRATSIVVLI
jgi:hypothetical protein